MKKFYLLFFILTAFGGITFGASVSITLDFDGAQAQGCCNLCGDDYWCINNTGGCGTTNPSATATFMDPVPAGNVITGVTVQVQGASCFPQSVQHRINNVNICTTGAAPDCSCGMCHSLSCSQTFTCGITGYNYGGQNTYTITASGNAFCWDRTIITFTYAPSSSLIPPQPGPISGPNPACPNSTATYSISPVPNATSYNWTVPAGWVINSGQGTTSINVTVGANGGQVCVTASNSCGTSPPSCLNVSISNQPPSVGPISGPTSLCQGQTATYSITPVGNAISYSWSVPQGSSIISGQGTPSINMQAGPNSGNVNVTVTDQCGFTGTATLPITIYSSTNAGTLCCNDTICIGGSGQITLTGYNGQIIKWQYSTDGGQSWIDINFTGNVYSYAGIMDTTMYQVVVQNGPCLPQTSNPVTIYVVPSPGIPILSPNKVDLCQGDTVVLHLSYDQSQQTIQAWEFSTNNGSTWTSIPGWTADTLVVWAPVGTTWWRVKVSGPGGGFCGDSVSTIAVVNIYPPSDGGILSKDTVICEKAPFCLNLSNYVGSITNWEYSFDSSTWFVLSNVDSFLCVSNLLNSAYFRVRVKSGVCAADYSNVVYIEVHKSSMAGEAKNNIVVCKDNNSGIVYTTGYLGNVIGWLYSTDSITWNWAPGSNDDTLPFSNISQNTWYAVVVQNGVCPPDTSNIVKVWVVPPPNGGTILSDITVCYANSKDTLYLVGYSGQIVQWEYSQDSGYTWVAIQNNSPSQVVLNIKDTTWYRVKLSNGVCPPVYSDTAYVYVVLPPIPGNLFIDTAFCQKTDSGMIYLLNYTGNIIAYLISRDSGKTWDTLIKGGVQGGQPLNDTIFYPDTITQSFYVIAVISNGVCPPVTSDTVKVDVVPKTKITALDDYVVIPPNLTYTITPTANDTGNWNFIDIIALPANGQVKITSTNSIIYTPASGYLGKDNFTYVICEKTCKVCDTANVYLIVGIYVPEGFSPNGDGVNDYLIIGGIEQFPNNKLYVYNRWGDLVYSASPYLNDWDGTLKTNGLALKGKVPDGTYFYILDLGAKFPLFKGTFEIRSTK